MNPSPLIKLAMTGVISLLKNKAETFEWPVVKQEFNKPGFIKMVVDFSFDGISLKTVTYVRDKFIKDPDFDVAKILKAS
jgi:hypothetical protein